MIEFGNRLLAVSLFWATVVQGEKVCKRFAAMRCRVSDVTRHFRGFLLRMIETWTREFQRSTPTSNGARSLGVSLANNRVYVATTAKQLVCRRFIVVYAPE